MSLSDSCYRFLIRKRLTVVGDTAREMAQYSTRAEIETFQLRRFNNVWRTAYMNIPFYAGWRERYGLPEKIDNLAELDNWPVLTKADLRDLNAFRPSYRIPELPQAYSPFPEAPSQSS